MTFPNGFKPILSGNAPEDLSTLKFPVLVSPKLDGIRCIMWGGVAYSRKLKPIPNKWIQQCLNTLPDGFDGELIVGAPVNQSPTDSVIQRTSSGVMSRDGRPDFTYYVFDWWHDDPDVGFGERLENVKISVGYVDIPLIPVVNAVAHYPVGTIGALMDLEQKFVEQGYEGIMIRDIHGRYKFGRSTTKEGTLLKLKRFHDCEARIVDFVERMHNANEATTDNLGHTKRSTHKANKVPMGTLGALVCELNGTRFEVGTGFTDAQRQMIWDDREAYRGALTKIKYQELTPDGVPRFPVWLDFRSESDT